MCYYTSVLEAAIAVFVVEYVAGDQTVAAKPDEGGEDCIHCLFRCMLLAGG